MEGTAAHPGAARAQRQLRILRVSNQKPTPLIVKLGLVLSAVLVLPLVPMVVRAAARATTLVDLLGGVLFVVVFWFSLVLWLALHVTPLLMLVAAAVVTFRLATEKGPEWREPGFRPMALTISWLLAGAITALCWKLLTTSCESMLSKGPMCVVVDSILSW